MERALAAEAVVLKQQEEKQKQQQNKGGQQQQQQQGRCSEAGGAARTSSSGRGGSLNGGADGDVDGGAAEQEARQLLKKAEAAQRVSSGAGVGRPQAQMHAPSAVCTNGRVATTWRECPLDSRVRLAHQPCARPPCESPKPTIATHHTQ